MAPQLTGEKRNEMLERALAAALALRGEGEQARALAALAPQLSGEKRNEVLERALAAALALQDGGLRVQALIPFLSSLEDQDLLLHRIRQAMLDYAWSMQYASRRGTLPVFRQGSLGSVYFLTPNTWDYRISHHRDL